MFTIPTAITTPTATTACNNSTKGKQCHAKQARPHSQTTWYMPTKTETVPEVKVVPQAQPRDTPDSEALSQLDTRLKHKMMAQSKAEGP